MKHMHFIDLMIVFDPFVLSKSNLSRVG